LIVKCAPMRAPATLAPAESMFQGLHAGKDRTGVTSARGASADTNGTPLAELQRRYAAMRAPFAAALAAIDAGALAPEDRRALAAMRASLAGGLASDADDTESGDPATHAPPDCDYDAAAIARGDSAYERLERRIYACYTRAVQRVQFEGKALDRLTAIGMLAQMDDREQRHRLFLAIDTIWRSMNGDDGARSPYREFVKLSAARWRARGSPVDAEARVLRIDPAHTILGLRVNAWVSLLTCLGAVGWFVWLGRRGTIDRARYPDSTAAPHPTPTA